MPFNINEFKANTLNTRWTVKPNKFIARFPLPIGLQSGNPNYDNLKNTSRMMELWCNMGSLPGAATRTYDAPRYGYGATEKRVFGPIFQDLNFMFYGDAGTKRKANVGTNFDFFTSWVRLATNFDMSSGSMYNPNTRRSGGGIGGTSQPTMYPYEISYKYEYAVNVEVIAYTDNGQPAYSVVLRDAFPTYVQEVRTSWGDNSGVLQLPVLMTFTDWYMQDLTWNESGEYQLSQLITPQGTAIA